VATNTTLGLVKGDAQDGKVYVELDGTQSVYGWGDLKTAVGNIASKMNANYAYGASVSGNTLTVNLRNIFTGSETAVAIDLPNAFTSVSYSGNILTFTKSDGTTQTQAITLAIGDVTGLGDALSGKQDRLTAGANITIQGSTISATGSGSPTGPAGGDLSGNYPNPTIPKLAFRGNTVANYKMDSPDSNNYYTKIYEDTHPTTLPGSIVTSDCVLEIFMPGYLGGSLYYFTLRNDWRVPITTNAEYIKVVGSYNELDPTIILSSTVSGNNETRRIYIKSNSIYNRILITEISNRRTLTSINENPTGILTEYAPSKFVKASGDPMQLVKGNGTLTQGYVDFVHTLPSIYSGLPSLSYNNGYMIIMSSDKLSVSVLGFSHCSIKIQMARGSRANTSSNFSFSGQYNSSWVDMANTDDVRKLETSVQEDISALKDDLRMWLKMTPLPSVGNVLNNSNMSLRYNLKTKTVVLNIDMTISGSAISAFHNFYTLKPSYQANGVIYNGSSVANIYIDSNGVVRTSLGITGGPWRGQLVWDYSS